MAVTMTPVIERLWRTVKYEEEYLKHTITERGQISLANSLTSTQRTLHQALDYQTTQRCITRTGGSQW
jgi:hypothetical protein